MPKVKLIDPSIPENFALMHILFKNLLPKALKLPSTNFDKLEFDNFYEGFTKYYSELGESVPNDTNIRRIVGLLKHNFQPDYVDKRKQTNTYLSRLCHPVRSKRGHHFDWDDFKLAYQDEANEKLRKKVYLEYCSALQLFIKPKTSVIISISSYGLEEELNIKLKTRIEKILFDNFGIFDDEIIIPIIADKIDPKESEFKNNPDIIIRGRVIGQNNDDLNVIFDYRIANEKYSNRLNKSSFEKTKKSEHTSLLKLMEGHLQGSVINSISAIIALKYYFELNWELAIANLKKIPKVERIAEIWFILGVCYYELENPKKAKACWTKAHERGHLKASINLALLLESEYKNSVQNEEKLLLKYKIIEMLPMNKLNSAPSEVQFKAAIIFEHLLEDSLSIHLLQLVIKDNKSNYFQDALLFLAMIAGDINQIQEILMKECSLDLKKAATFYLLKSQRLETDQKNDLSLQLLNNLDMEDPETERFYADMIQLISIEKLRLNGFKSKSIDSMPNDIEVKSSSHSLDPDDILGEKTLSEGSVDSIKNSIEAPSEKKKERILYWLENHFQNYLTGLRSTSPNKSYFLFDMHFIRKTKLKEYTTIRLYLSEIEDFLELTQDAVGMFPVSREQLEDFYLEEIPEKLAVKVFHPDPNGHFLDSEITINLAIPNLGTLRDEIEQLTLFVPYQNAEEYYKAIRNYLEEFYGSVDPFDMNDWLCDVGLAYEDVRIFINA